ncbi:MAG: GTPase ObgE [Candidatus Marinimicrobia bacterium]|nr:GTPase ObgE [Candidatus Neomarinimicrobiota bacterium]
MNFIDFASIHVKAGNGGNGCSAFLREKFRPKGGPAGGDGGRGGHVIVVSDSNLSTLHDVSYNKRYFAKKGEDGRGKNMHGKNGADIIIRVPLGTIIRNVDTDHFIDDLKDDKKEIIIARGGNGGFGNARFKTQNNPAPRKANSGQEGEEKKLELELKVLADVGLVGFPNAGKSTLISKISNAKPKVADYPFTTLEPNLGIVRFHEFKSFVIADIPGLIEGASSGKGLGLKFLKHIERTKILVYMIDVNTESIDEEYKVLKGELEKYNADLVDKPSILLLTKCDVEEENESTLSLKENIKFIKISSLKNINLDKAIYMMTELLESN